jgi:hypothetical protein
MFTLSAPGLSPTIRDILTTTITTGSDGEK